MLLKGYKVPQVGECQEEPEVGVACEGVAGFGDFFRPNAEVNTESDLEVQVVNNRNVIFNPDEFKNEHVMQWYRKRLKEISHKAS